MKKRPKRVIFDEESRREFVTGFRKRKLARKKKAADNLQKQLQEAKKTIKTQARTTYHSLVNSYLPSTNIISTLEKQYELPEHTVKVCEFQIDSENYVERDQLISDEVDDSLSSVISNHDHSNVNLNNFETVPVNSLKQVKKLVNKQAKVTMQNSKAFKKKSKLERLQNQKKARTNRKLLKKRKHQKKRRKYSRVGK